MKLGGGFPAEAPANTPAPTEAPAPADDTDFGLGDTPVPDAQSAEKPFNDEPFDAGVDANEETDPKKFIEQLTGKLGQSLRKYNETQGQPDLELEKFAINSLLSAAHTGSMNPDDQKDIIKKVEDGGNKSEEPSEEPEIGNDTEEPADDSSDVFDGDASLNEDISTSNPIQTILARFNNGDELDKQILSRLICLSDDVSLEEFSKVLNEEWDETEGKEVLNILEKTKQEITQKAKTINNEVNEGDFILQNPPKNNMFQEGSNDILDEMKPCWKGYKQIGTKTKDGKEVPNCVPVNEAKNLIKPEKKSIFEKDKIKSKIKETFNQEDMTQPITKPDVKPKTAPVEPSKPSRKNKPFLPEVAPGTVTQPKATS